MQVREMEFLREILENTGFFSMLGNIKNSNPQWKFWKFRILEGILIAICVAFILGFFKDTYVPKNDTMQSDITEIKTMIKEDRVQRKQDKKQYEEDIDNIQNNLHKMDKRLMRVEGTLFNWEEWNGE